MEKRHPHFYKQKHCTYSPIPVSLRSAELSTSNTVLFQPLPVVPSTPPLILPKYDRRAQPYGVEHYRALCGTDGFLEVRRCFDQRHPGCGEYVLIPRCNHTFRTDVGCGERFRVIGLGPASFTLLGRFIHSWPFSSCGVSM